MSKADERAAAQDRRLKEANGRLADAERGLARLAPEEGCRDRLAAAVRKLEEEAQARAAAEERARAAEERARAAGAAAAAAAADAERERADKVAAQAAVAAAGDKGFEMMRSLGSAEQARLVLSLKVSELQAEMDVRIPSNLGTEP